MINKQIREALKLISKELKNKKIRWVLIGSTSLALQGVKVKPKDIDILTDKEGAIKMNEILKKYETQPVKFGRSEMFESYWGKFMVKGIRIEVMGNLKEKINGKWSQLLNRLKSHEIIKLESLRIPVSPLKEQLMGYENLRRKKDLSKIKEIKQALG
jgi:predicted nucleotidyltransferase